MKAEKCPWHLATGRSLLTFKRAVSMQWWGHMPEMGVFEREHKFSFWYPKYIVLTGGVGESQLFSGD